MTAVAHLGLIQIHCLQYNVYQMTVAMEVAMPLMDGEKISPSRVRVTTQLKPREKKKRVMPIRGR